MVVRLVAGSTKKSKKSLRKKKENPKSKQATIDRVIVVWLKMYNATL